ncbi:hypothetical protein AWC04_12775 [Mycolicibacterium fallax]|uniref:Uncharacterized protein n=1 Tax=Mycolicibacterium fallax TaxID=1793 RepID=A0A1X1R932_MYCFA|nr:hypothetical protein AWC04_12775 [Mycolicibacterium fallax]
MKKIVIIAGVGVALLCALLFVPVKVTCPNGPCSTAPDARGNIHRYYELKPLGADLVEQVTGLRVPIHYGSGMDAESVK